MRVYATLTDHELQSLLDVYVGILTRMALTKDKNTVPEEFKNTKRALENELKRRRKTA